MNVLILGSGGREHAIAWKIHQSKKCTHLFVAPGNGGTEEIAYNLSIDINDFSSISKNIINHKIDLLIVGPEKPLVDGIVDFLKDKKEHRQLKIVGPNKLGAQLEGSKEFSKKFMERYHIPTAKAEVVTKDNLNQMISKLSILEPPYVLKSDGLAGGKGVIITEDIEEAKMCLNSLILDKKFGTASEKVLIEKFLKGTEVSFFVLTDGNNYVMLPEAKDYKRIGENDTGLNTGGMGAVSPVIFADDLFKKKVEQKIVIPTILGLKKEKIHFCGFIFFGLINVKNHPYVIEYNVRMGDPEAEAVLPRIKSDFLDLLMATADGKLGEFKISIEPFTTASIVYVSNGYPEAYEKGQSMVIGKNTDAATCFHAGTTTVNGKLVTHGGRVVAVTGKGSNLKNALKNAQNLGKNIKWKDKKFRSDIGIDLQKLGQ